MKGITFSFITAATLGGVVAHMAAASGPAETDAAPIYSVKLPSGFRDWKLISVAHEEGRLTDIRAILGNDIAVKAYRDFIFARYAP